MDIYLSTVNGNTGFFGSTTLDTLDECCYGICTLEYKDRVYCRKPSTRFFQRVIVDESKSRVDVESFRVTCDEHRKPLTDGYDDPENFSTRVMIKEMTKEEVLVHLIMEV